MSSLFLLVCFLSYVFCCAVSICAVVFVLLSEMYPTKVRGLAMSIAGFSLWIGTYLIGQLTPWMLQNLTPAGTFFLFAAMCVPYMLIVWKLVPETTGKSLEEIERYWTRLSEIVLNYVREGNDFPNQDVKSFSYEKLKEIMKKADDPSYQINDDIMKKPINEAE